MVRPDSEKLSDELTYDVVFWIVHGKRLVDNLSSTQVVLPDETFERRFGHSSFLWGGIDVIFRDNSGHTWRRNVRGQLMERSRIDAWMLQYFPAGFTPRALLHEGNDDILFDDLAENVPQDSPLDGSSFPRSPVTAPSSFGGNCLTERPLLPRCALMPSAMASAWA
jgi:hypothetical protein